MNFKDIPNIYRPIPFWSWNEKLEASETADQVKTMNSVGIGGFFMHARGGLQTEFMSDEWFENVDSAVDKAEELGMYAWAYDENGWPSGFGDGRVNGRGIKYQQKYLRMEDTHKHKETEICKCGEHWFYYDVNPFYVDTLDKDVIKVFIDEIYQPYYDRYKNRIEGFFTDEPQISRDGIPWSFVFEKEYRERYNDDILLHLEELFVEKGDYVQTRFRFWKMVTDLFSSAFMKQIYDWCEEHGMKLTGHLVCEETFHSQLTSNGACMPHYEYFHIPGMDWLSRSFRDYFTVNQLGSATEQLGKKHVLSETFALCGHNVSFEELKGIYEMQMVRGVNLLCQHLEGYSIRGMRKRDYPPAMYYQQPWWKDYKIFVDAMSRIGMILAESEVKCDVLVIHPQTKAWTLYNDKDTEPLEKFADEFNDVLKSLERKHIQFHLGDETLMERHGSVEDGKLVIGKQKYSKVILFRDDVLFPNTVRLLDEYKKQGGAVVSADEIETNDVVDSELITYTKRYMGDKTVHYFVNTNNEVVEAKVNVKGKMLDIETGELNSFCGCHVFERYGSLMIIEDGSENVACEKTEKTYVSLNGEFDICDCTDNSLTLDYCDYYFDGELQEKNGFVLNITESANALERPVQIHQDYHVKVNSVPEKIMLVCETPEKFKITVNGKAVENTVEGYYRDKSFKCINIRPYVTEGENTISFDCNFYQKSEVYENIKKGFVFESEKNKLSYDTEIEAIYLIGDFSVKTPGKWEELEREAVRYTGEFVIDKPADKVNISSLHDNGFPFFSGTISVCGKINVFGKNPVLKLNKKGINIVTVSMNGTEKTFLWNADEIDLTGWAKDGENEIKISLTNNLRNLLGPHHMGEECYAVGPRQFPKIACVWTNGNDVEDFDDNYCFVKTGI